MEQVAQRSRFPGWLQAALIGRSPKRTLARIVILVTAVILIRMYVLIPIHIEGPSMFPTYNDSGINFVNRLAYLFKQPHRTDVVAIRTSGTSVMYMKRIVGLPGETIAFEKGKLTVNGQPLEEPYVKLPCAWDRPPVTLGLDEYFFVGDNRSMRMRDHEFGKAERGRIVGKILLCDNILGWLF